MSADALPTAISGDSDPQHLNRNAGTVNLLNRGKAVLFLHQTSGDQVTRDPEAPGYTGKVLVYSSSKQLVASLDATEVESGYLVLKAHIAALDNSGFVVVWSTQDAHGNYSTAYCETFDNNGNPSVAGSAHHLVSDKVAGSIRVTGLTGGGFAIVYGSDSQQDVLTVFSPLGGTFDQNETLIGDPDTLVQTSTEASATIKPVVPTPRMVQLSEGSIIVEENTYVWVSPNYTPLGEFVYKFDSTGNPTTFDNGLSNLRVDWSGGQNNNDFNLIALSTGGFAVIGRSYYSKNWEISVFNNDGTAVTTDTQSVNVTNGGTKTYPASVITAGPTLIDKNTDTSRSYASLTEIDGKLNAISTRSLSRAMKTLAEPFSGRRSARIPSKAIGIRESSHDSWRSPIHDHCLGTPQTFGWESPNVMQDTTCKLCNEQSRFENPYRVVFVQYDHGNEIGVDTMWSQLCCAYRLNKSQRPIRLDSPIAA